ncbi:hypothetical protein CWE13_02540 [Aliidiomarina shirensis]|uniref:Uncharacterized protein n=1 Tax=Aliidiomarina shirensis TaxID=1048642 RepID=A0A432WXM1_9GAMM|nr:hypothetical protein CWE13_02540 [Aliidiomarina shirensis]
MHAVIARDQYSAWVCESAGAKFALAQILVAFGAHALLIKYIAVFITNAFAPEFIIIVWRKLHI